MWHTIRFMLRHIWCTVRHVMRHIRRQWLRHVIRHCKLPMMWRTIMRHTTWQITWHCGIGRYNMRLIRTLCGIPWGISLSGCRRRGFSDSERSGGWTWVNFSRDRFLDRVEELLHYFTAPLLARMPLLCDSPLPRARHLVTFPSRMRAHAREIPSPKITEKWSSSMNSKPPKLHTSFDIN